MTTGKMGGPEIDHPLGNLRTTVNCLLLASVSVKKKKSLLPKASELFALLRNLINIVQ